MITGTPRFDGLAIGEISINYLENLVAKKEGNAPTISVKAGFVNSTTGATHGWTQTGGKHGGPQWSRAVIEKAAELRELLEQELAQLHFSSAEPAAVVQGGDEPDEGIGEYAGDGGLVRALPG
jgi:hypothetical protein